MSRHAPEVSSASTQHKAASLVSFGCGVSGTSVYLVQRRLDMIPPRLSTKICSLRSGVDRLAFSVIWQMDDEANVRSVRFAKTVIRSQAALAYDDCQKHLDADIKPEYDLDESVVQ